MPNSLRCRIKKWCYQGIFNEKDRDRLINGLDCADALQEIRQEIEKPLRQERFFDTENAKAQAIALNWCLEIIDKHIAERTEE